MEKEVIEALKLVIKAKDELIVQLREEISRLKLSNTISVPYTPPPLNPYPQPAWPLVTWITSGSGTTTIPIGTTTTTGFISAQPATVLEMNQQHKD